NNNGRSRRIGNVQFLSTFSTIPIQLRLNKSVSCFFNATNKYPPTNVIHENNNRYWRPKRHTIKRARKVDDDERLQYVIIGLQDAALQWYLNQVQADESHQLFASWESFAAGIKDAFQLPHYQQMLQRQLRDLKQTTTNILGQIDGMHEADKVMYFTEGLKGVTKAEVNYPAPENLDDAVKLAASYDSAMYGVIKNVNKRYSSQSKGQAPTPMELDRVESGNPVKFRPIKEKNKGSKTVWDEQKNEYKKQGLCFICGKKGHMAKECRSKARTYNEINKIENAEPKVAETTNVEKNEEHERPNRESLLKVEGEIQGKRALILIDSGASKDFINLNFVEKSQLEMDEKEVDTTTVKLVDGSLCKSRGNVTDVAVEFQGYKEKRKTMEVIPLQKYDMIFGKL
ncbi:3501_t:CDS:2, partial [Cetraspora pellucida]